MELTAEQKAEQEAKTKAGVDAAAKKAAEAAKAKEGKGDGEGEEGDDEGDDEPEEVDVEKLKAQNKKLREENAKRRVATKKVEEENQRQKKALGILQGKEVGEVDPLEAAQKAADAKLRRATLKGALASVAKDAHDPLLLLSAYPSHFEGVEVDLENESVDEDALEEAVAALRKKKPFLFGAGAADETKVDDKKTKFVKLPKGGPPKVGTDHMATWRQLKETDPRGAQEYYKKNLEAIRAQQKSQA